MDDADAVTLKITLHQGRQARDRPADAIDLLWGRLDSSDEGTRFSRKGGEIRVTRESDASRSVPRGELNALARAAIVAVVRDVCGRAPELEFEWFAISPA